MGEKLTEPGLRRAEACGGSEAAMQADLFVQLEVMGEFLLEPEILQLPDMVITLTGQTGKTEQNAQLNNDQSMTSLENWEDQRSTTNQKTSCTSNQKSIPHDMEHFKPAKEFKCSHCNYETAYKQNIRTHERIHTGGKPFRCQHCDLVFNQKTHLLRHEIRHTTDIKEFKCRRCNFASAYKQNLRVHETLHTGVKPFKCSQCDYATRLRESLQIHERLHAGTMFKCSSCDYSSANKRRLHAHEFKHTGEKPYKCKFCDFKTARAGSLKPHMISRHHYKS